jgi:hypothetical protein
LGVVVSESIEILAIAMLKTVFVIAALIVVPLGVVSILERRTKNRVMRDGVPIVGWIVQANMDLYQPGNGDEPALVLVSFDDVPSAEVDALARKMFALKGRRHSNPVDREVAALVDDEQYLRGGCFQLPLEFSGGLRVYVAHVMVERQLLPHGFLLGRQLPCRAIPSELGPVFHDQLSCETRYSQWRGKKRSKGAFED